jgi:clan AA aspartic protease
LSQAVIDTGFNGYLSVSSTVVMQSSWRYLGHEKYELADGQVVFEPVYLATVRFNDRLLQVNTVAGEGDCILIGTRLLDGKRLVIDFDTNTVLITDTRTAV